jgi:hypothetical protein
MALMRESYLVWRWATRKLDLNNGSPAMSALGQKRTFWPSIAMSALPPKADVDWHEWNVPHVAMVARIAAHWSIRHHDGNVTGK